MNQKQFKEERILGKNTLFNQAITSLTELNPVSIHLIGSESKGNEDEFSDSDIWVTFKDEDTDQVIEERYSIFSKIAPILIKHETTNNSPVDGSYSLVIYKTEYGLFHIDYYLSPISKTVILTHSKLVYGDDVVPRGEWSINTKAKHIKSSKERIDFLLCMAFIGIKKVTRGDSVNFEIFLISEYNKVKEEFIKYLPILNSATLNYKLIKVILENLYAFADDKQKLAIKEIQEYNRIVGELYS